jgi:outer membrane protein TolC
MAKGVTGTRGKQRIFSSAIPGGSRGAAPLARLAGLAQAVRRALAPHSLAVRMLGLGLTSLVASAGISSLAGCGNAENDPVFDPRAMQLNERVNASAPTPAEQSLKAKPEPLPTVHQDTTLKSGTTLPTTIPVGGLSGTDSPITRLSLREVIQRAVANSSDVRVAGYDPAINAQKVIQAQANFDPTFITNITPQRVDLQANDVPVTVFDKTTKAAATAFIGYNKQNIYTFESGIQQNTQTGGKISLTYQVDETDVDTPGDYREINPYWENQIKFQITQPLLRGFGTEVNAAKITISKDDERISVLEFRKTLETTIDQIEQDYWQLYEAEQEVLYDQQLVDSSLQTYNVLLNRLNKGLEDKDSGGGVPVAQAETRVKANQAVLVGAQLHVRDISMDLKRQMNDPEFPVSSPLVVLPADAPLQSPIEFNLKDQIDTALDNRLELGEQKYRIDETDVLLMTARNGELPQLDVVANATVQGLAGEWSTALRNQGEFNHIGYQIGIQFSYPIGNRQAKSATRQAQLQRLQAIEQYRNLITQISLDVELNWDAVYSAYEQAVHRYQSRLAAQHQIELLNRQEVSGVAQLTPPFVQVRLQALEDLATAQREEALALANYNIAIEKLQKAKGTLLHYDNVVMEEDPIIQRDNDHYHPRQ